MVFGCPWTFPASRARWARCCHSCCALTELQALIDCIKSCLPGAVQSDMLHQCTSGFQGQVGPASDAQQQLQCHGIMASCERTDCASRERSCPNYMGMPSNRCMNIGADSVTTEPTPTIHTVAKSATGCLSSRPLPPTQGSQKHTSLRFTESVCVTQVHKPPLVDRILSYTLTRA